ncbi:TPA: PIN domain-containing protein [Neisseria meningitidis]
MYLLDTNVISETRRANRADGNVRAWLNTIDPAEMYTSAIVMMELERGVLGMERKDGQQGGILRRWLEEVVKPTFKDRILPIDETTAEICAPVCTYPTKAPKTTPG